MEALLRFYQTSPTARLDEPYSDRIRSAAALAVCGAKSVRPVYSTFFQAVIRRYRTRLPQVSPKTALLVSAFGEVIVIIGFRPIDTFSQTDG